MQNLLYAWMFRACVEPADLRHVLYFLVSSLKEKIAGIQRGPCIFGSMQLIWPINLETYQISRSCLQCRPESKHIKPLN